MKVPVVSPHQQPKSPRENARWCSILSFSWIFPLLWKGYKNPLELEDIYRVLPGDRSEHVGKEAKTIWKEHLRECNFKKKPPSLLKALMKLFGGKFWRLAILSCVNETFILVLQTFSLEMLLQALQLPEKGEYKRHMCHWTSYLAADECFTIYLACGGVIFANVWSALTNHILSFSFHHLWTHIRIACSVLIFEKSLKLNQASLESSHLSDAVTLMSNDVNRLDELDIFVMYLLVAPIHLSLIMYLMYRYFGYSGLIGLGIIVVYMIIQFIFDPLFTKTRLNTTFKTDQRLRILTEIFNCIKVIKLYGWEEFFLQKASASRKDELRYVKQTLWLRAINSALSFTITKVIAFVTMLMYVKSAREEGMENFLSPKIVFVTMYLYEHLRFVITIYFSRAMEDFVELSIALKRIQKFLMQKERVDRKKYSIEASNDFARSDVGIEIENCSFEPTNPHSIPLTNISFTLKGSGITMIIGPGGSGKSSMLQAIWGHIPTTEGRLITKGNLAYLSSEPWIFRGTIQENIIFGSKVRLDWYERVIEACALIEVFASLPNRDQTRIDSTTMSKGHMCRITLARSVYLDTHIYLLDDPFVHIDIHAARHIMDKCINGILKRKLVVLATTQLQYLQCADRIILLSRGKVRMDGTYNDFKTRQSIFMDQKANIFDDIDLADNSSIANAIFCITNIDDNFDEAETSDLDKSPPESKMHVVVTRVPDEAHGHDTAQFQSGEQLLHIVESNTEMESDTHTGAGCSIYRKYIQVGSNYCVFTILGCICIITQIVHSGSDYFLEYFTKEEEDRFKDEMEVHANHRKNLANSTETLHQQKSSPSSLHSSMLLKNISTERNQQILYLMMILVTFLIVSWIRTIFFYWLCANTSKNSYNKLMHSLLRAPASFYECNPTGRVLNRLSQDIKAIDDHIPPCFYELLDTFCLIVGVLVIIILVNYYLAIPIVVILISKYLLQAFHERTLTSLKRQEGITRGPVMGTLTTALRGIATIHAFEQEDLFIEKFHNALDIHTATWHAFLSSQRWLGFVFGWISVCFVAIVTFTLITQHSDYSDASVAGLGIVSALSLTALFQYDLRLQAEIDALMVSVGRIMEFSSIESEADWNSNASNKIPENWPHMGEIKWSGVSVQIANHILLKNICCHIHPKEKIGVVGRSGSGKSLFLNTFLRVIEPSAGSIVIDGVNILKIGLHDLRHHLAYVPAEPELFLGTIRENYDPFHHHSDDSIWQVLRDTYLFDHIKAMPLGLDTEIDDEGLGFNVPQKQLICLGRALLNNSRVVICDLNPESDELVQEIIMSNFRHSTVIASAHQLHNAVEFERVIVMKNGMIDDFDEPIKLLQKQKGAFAELTRNFGSNNIKKLSLLAQDAKVFNSRNKTSQNISAKTKSQRLYNKWRKLSNLS